MKQIVFAAHGCPIGCLGPYGNEWIATPNFDRLAAEGIVYDRHFAEFPDALAARKAWWQFRESVHRVLVRASRAEHDAPAEFYAPFHEWFDARPSSDDPSPGDALLRILPEVLDSLVDRASWILWIECDRMLPPWDAPQHVFEVYVEDLFEAAGEDEEPLQPWLNPPEGAFDSDDLAQWELLHRSYATAVTAFDADLGRLWEMLLERKLDETASFVFTSDFGFPLGEHGIVGPEESRLHEEFVHLPLMVRKPNANDAGMRISAFTKPSDLMAILNEEALPERDCVISTITREDGTEHAIRTDSHALILLEQAADAEEIEPPLLFLKPEDRWEVNDVSRTQADDVERLEAQIRAAMR